MPTPQDIQALKNNPMFQCDFNALKTAIEKTVEKRLTEEKNRWSYNQDKLLIDQLENIAGRLKSTPSHFELWAIGFIISYEIPKLLNVFSAEIRRQNVFNAGLYQLMMEEFIQEPLTNAMITLFRTTGTRIFQINYEKSTDKLIIANDQFESIKKICEALQVERPQKKFTVEEVTDNDTKQPEQNAAAAVSTTAQPSSTTDNAFKPLQLDTLTEPSVLANILIKAAEKYLHDFPKDPKIPGEQPRDKGRFRNKHIIHILTNELEDSDPTKIICTAFLMLAALNNGEETPRRIVLCAMDANLVTLSEIQGKLDTNVFNTDSPKKYSAEAMIKAKEVLTGKVDKLLQVFYKKGHIYYYFQNNFYTTLSEITTGLKGTHLATSDTQTVFTWPHMPEIESQVVAHYQNNYTNQFMGKVQEATRGSKLSHNTFNAFKKLGEILFIANYPEHYPKRTLTDKVDHLIETINISQTTRTDEYKISQECFTIMLNIIERSAIDRFQPNRPDKFLLDHPALKNLKNFLLDQTNKTSSIEHNKTQEKLTLTHPELRTEDKEFNKQTRKKLIDSKKLTLPTEEAAKLDSTQKNYQLDDRGYLILEDFPAPEHAQGNNNNNNDDETNSTQDTTSDVSRAFEDTPKIPDMLLKEGTSTKASDKTDFQMRIRLWANPNTGMLPKPPEVKTQTQKAEQQPTTSLAEAMVCSGRR